RAVGFDELAARLRDHRHPKPPRNRHAVAPTLFAARAPSQAPSGVSELFPRAWGIELLGFEESPVQVSDRNRSIERDAHEGLRRTAVVRARLRELANETEL